MDFLRGWVRGLDLVFTLIVEKLIELVTRMFGHHKMTDAHHQGAQTADLVDNQTSEHHEVKVKIKKKGNIQVQP